MWKLSPTGGSLIRLDFIQCKNVERRRAKKLRKYALTFMHDAVRSISVAARSKAWTVFARLNAGIMNSKPTEDVNICIVCVYSALVLFCA
jgi:hypothetical protein